MGLTIVSGAVFSRALERARSVELSASLLPRGKNGVAAALERAAERGARVVVHLDSDPYDPSGTGGRTKLNAATVAALRVHGVEADLTDQPRWAPMHLKAAVVDERVFLDDRNWLADGRDTIVSSGAIRDAAAVRAAMRGKHAADPHLATRKREALALEADTIAGSRGAVEVESESFGSGVVACALLERARAGSSVRLLVSARDLRGDAREERTLAQLSAAGVEIRLETGVRDEKLCVAGDRGWVGSANATSGFPDTVDWGVRSGTSRVVDTLKAVFERNWRSAKPFTSAGSVSHAAEACGYGSRSSFERVPLRSCG